MIKIREIEKVISSLPPKELTAFRKWFTKFDSEQWDKQFESDVKAGKLDKLANKAVEDFKKGKGALC